MRLHSLAGFFIAAALVASGSGCTEKSLGSVSGADNVATIKISGARRDVSASHTRLFDLYVSGDGNTVRVPSGSAIRTLWVSGVNHRITVAAGASVQTIQLSGVGTSIDLPENVHVAVSSSGVGSRVIKDSDGEDLGE